MPHEATPLVAVMDWYSRAVLSWRVPNTMDTDFCVDAVQDALRQYGPPEIFNTDQGSQFTSSAFTTCLQEAGIQISMDGRGRWMDNVMIERLWRSIKYESLYLQELTTGAELFYTVRKWMDFYNHHRHHVALSGKTPMKVYLDQPRVVKAEKAA